MFICSYIIPGFFLSVKGSESKGARMYSDEGKIRAGIPTGFVIEKTDRKKIATPMSDVINAYY